VFVVDFDEEVPAELAEEVRRTVNETPRHSGYFVCRDNCFFGRHIRHASSDSDKVMRLFRKSRRHFADKSVHPVVEIDGSAGSLKTRIRHEPYPTLSEYLKKLGRYTLWKAKDASRKGTCAGVWRLFFHPVGRFGKMYLLRGGFLDGTHGLVLSMLGTMSVFTKYARLWEIEQQRIALLQLHHTCRDQ